MRLYTRHRRWPSLPLLALITLALSGMKCGALLDEYNADCGALVTDKYNPFPSLIRDPEFSTWVDHQQGQRVYSWDREVHNLCGMQHFRPSFTVAVRHSETPPGASITASVAYSAVYPDRTLTLYPGQGRGDGANMIYSGSLDVGLKQAYGAEPAPLVFMSITISFPSRGGTDEYVLRDWLKDLNMEVEFYRPK